MALSLPLAGSPSHRKIPEEPEIKPESKHKIAEMAEMLKQSSKLKLFVVGYTDNDGSLESNTKIIISPLSFGR
ncbi:MAG: hypothetical protein HZB62_14730 [Nitrospirae bacterium]|nr:hypothetical protein [Nitrospirota bacterium]